MEVGLRAAFAGITVALTKREATITRYIKRINLY